MHKKTRRNSTPSRAHTLGNIRTNFSAKAESNFVNDINIDIVPETSNDSRIFRVKVRGNGPPRSCQVRWNDEDLKAEALAMIEAIRRLTWPKVKPEDLKEVARIGYAHYREIFGSEAIRSQIESLIDRNDKIRVCVVSSSFIYPWNFLYTKDLSEEVDPNAFLGMHSVFYRRLDDINGDDEDPHFAIDIGNRADILYGWCHRLDLAVKTEIKHVRGLHRQDTLRKCVEIPELRQNDGAEKNVQIIAEQLKENKPVFIHLACHAENGSATRDRRIKIRNDTFLSELDFKNGDLQFDENPIVFLNACRLGFPDPTHFSSFIRYLESIGARSVLAPECKIGDAKASKFAVSFLNHVFLDEVDLCEALFLARRERWEVDRDLTGLVYALYGQPDAKILKRGSK